MYTAYKDLHSPIIFKNSNLFLSHTLPSTSRVLVQRYTRHLSLYMINMKVLKLCTVLSYAFMIHHHHHQVNAITSSDETAANQQNTEFDNQKEIEFNIGVMNTKLQVKPVHVFTSGLDILRCLGICMEQSHFCNGINYFRAFAFGSSSTCELLGDHFDDHETRRKLVCEQGWFYYGISQMSVGIFIYYLFIYLFYKSIMISRRQWIDFARFSITTSANEKARRVSWLARLRVNQNDFNRYYSLN